MAPRGEITDLLAAVRRGEPDAMDRLMPLVYEELYARAHHQLNRLRLGETLNTTALVNESYIKLVDHAEVDWRDRNHFLSVASLAMRQIVVDCARKRMAQKRGGEQKHELLDEARLGIVTRAAEVLAIDLALSALAEHDPRLGKVVELLFYGGLTRDEAAGVLGVNERTVRRDWKKAKMFLKRALTEQPPAVGIS